MNMTDKTEMIKNLLLKHPHLRDDNNKLLATVWNMELGAEGIDSESISGHELLALIATGTITKSGSITRVSRKLQETKVELRGDKYNRRHAHQEDVLAQLQTME